MSELASRLMAPAAVSEAGGESWGLRAVRALYYLFIFSIPVETIIYYQGDQTNPNSGISLSRMVGFALLGLAVTQWKHCFRKLPLAFWLLLWYVLVNASTQLWIPSFSFPRFHEQQQTLLQMVMLFVLSVNVLSDTAFRQRLFRAYGWWMVLVAIGMVSGVFGVDIGGSTESRDTLMTQDPNATAALYTAAALCLAGDARLMEVRRRLPRAVLTLAGMLVLIVSILRTGSRGGMIAFIAGFLGLALCTGGATRKARVIAAFVVLVLGGGLVRLEFARGSSTAERIQRSWDEGDTAGRTEIYDEAWRMFEARPVFGYGGGNNRYVLGANLNYPDRDTHNTFLHVLTEVGVFGAWGFFAALLYAMLNGWRAGRRSGDAVPFALMCAMLVVNSSITGIREKIFWVVLAAAVAAGLRSATPPEDAEREGAAA